MSEEGSQNNNLSSYEEDDIGLGQRLEKDQKHPMSISKSIFLSVLIAALVVASFWLSFLAGKKMFRAEKSSPQIQVVPTPETVTIPLEEKGIELTEETPVENQPTLKINKEQMLAEEEKAPPKKAAKKIAPKKVVQEEVVVEVENEEIASPVKYYKVQVGLYADKKAALAKQNILKDKGYDCVLIKVGDKWRVQAGAFKKKSFAEKLIETFENEEISAEVVYE